MEIDHVQLAGPPGCEETARRFWMTLGFVEIEKPPALANRGGCWFRNGSAEIHIGIEEPSSMISTPWHASKAHPGFVVDDLDVIADLIGQTGTACSWDDLLPGRRRFYTQDPFGNRLEFLSSPGG